MNITQLANERLSNLKMVEQVAWAEQSSDETDALLADGDYITVEALGLAAELATLEAGLAHTDHADIKKNDFKCKTSTWVGKCSHCEAVKRVQEWAKENGYSDHLTENEIDLLIIEAEST